MGSSVQRIVNYLGATSLMVLVEHPRLHIQPHTRSASIAAHLPRSLSPLLFLAPTFLRCAPIQNGVMQRHMDEDGEDSEDDSGHIEQKQQAKTER